MQSTQCITIANPMVPLKPAHNKWSCQFTALTPSTANSRIATMTGATSVNYNSTVSVFPAEACETVGGDACLVDMYPEAKLQTRAYDQGRRARVDSDLVDREYLEYNDSKTVFLAEACDDLGGEFCSSEYQKGVY